MLSDWSRHFRGYAALKTTLAGALLFASLLPALPVRGETVGARLDVVSDPSGSFISSNGRYFGVTPLTGVELAPGRYVIQAAKSGYEPLERWIDVEAMGHRSS